MLKKILQRIIWRKLTRIPWICNHVIQFWEPHCRLFICSIQIWQPSSTSETPWKECGKRNLQWWSQAGISTISCWDQGAYKNAVCYSYPSVSVQRGQRRTKSVYRYASIRNVGVFARKISPTGSVPLSLRQREVSASGSRAGYMAVLILMSEYGIL